VGGCVPGEGYLLLGVVSWRCCGGDGSVGGVWQWRQRPGTQLLLTRFIMQNYILFSKRTRCGKTKISIYLVKQLVSLDWYRARTR